MLIGNPDRDLKHLYISFGEKFIKNMLKYYNHPNSEILFKKLYFFEKSDPVLGVLHGLRHKKDDFVKKYLNDLSKI